MGDKSKDQDETLILAKEEALAGADDFGESSYDNALPWSHIKAADYKPVANLKAILPRLTALHEKRINQGKCMALTGMIYSDIVVALRKINGHILNVAESMAGSAGKSGAMVV